MYGDVARSWSEVEKLFEEMSEINVQFRSLRLLTRFLDEQGFVEAGLFGCTSMHDLLLAPCKMILDEPHLVISASSLDVTLQYRQGGYGAIEWERSCSHVELNAAVERVLVKRLRWFRDMSIERPNEEQ